MDWLDYYDKAWAARARVFDALLAEEGDLARIFGRFDHFESVRPLAADASGEVAHRPAEQPADSLAGLERVETGMSCATPVPVSAYTEFNVGRLLADLAVGADVVAEIGSGYGRQLFNLWLAGGGTGQTRFVGYEPNRSGRELACRLARLVPKMPVEFLPGDFITFDAAPLAAARRGLLFTHFSAMYQEWLPADFFSRLAALDGEFLLVFIEPLGGQIGRDGLEADHVFNKDFMRRFGEAAAAGLIEPLYLGRDLFGRPDRITHISVMVALKPGRK